MSGNSGMAVPVWVDSMKDKMVKAHQEVRLDDSPVTVRQLEVIEVFSTHFAEYELKENDLLVHLFPRGGPSDRWYPSDYRDGKYIPARREVRAGVMFPDDMMEKIKSAVDVVWQGDVAIDKAIILAIDPAEEDIENATTYEHDTGAFSVQFQEAANTVKLVDIRKFMDQFCEAIDKQLG